MSSYQYSEYEPKGINSKSYEPEIEHWLKGTAGEIDCIEDAQFGPTEHLSVALREGNNYDQVFWAMQENGTEYEELMLYGLSDDDLETLTIHSIEDEIGAIEDGFTLN